MSDTATMPQSPNGCGAAPMLKRQSSASQVYREAWDLYGRHSGSATSTEWPNLRRDLTDLAGPVSLRQKLRITKRISRVYTIFAF